MIFMVFNITFINLITTILSISSIPNNYPFIQTSETAITHTILLYEPSIEIFMGSLYPNGFLFKDVVSLNDILDDYQNLKKIFKALNIQIFTIKEALKKDRTKLETLAYDSINFHQKDYLEDNHYISDAYKRSLIKKATSDILIDAIITRPTYHISSTDRNTMIIVDYITYKPLSNLIFCRDQQIVTKKGVVLTNMNTPQRDFETKIIELALHNLGITPIGAILGEAKLEGGDYMAIKDDLVFLGIGLRTNFEGACYLMENDLLGYKRLALIIDTNDFHQSRTHLDTFFNIISTNEVALLDLKTIDLTNDLRRRVNIYAKQRVPGMHGYYNLVDSGLDFEEFLIKEGFKILKLNHQEQKEQMLNFLNIGDNQIISGHKALATKLKEFGSKIHVYYVNFTNVHYMYGSIHSVTQAYRKNASVNLDL